VKTKLILPIILFSFQFSHSQIIRDAEGNSNQEEFIEDANNYNKVFAIKTDLFRALIGEITLAGEYRATRNMGIEANVMYVYYGFLLPLGVSYDGSETYKSKPTVGGGAAVRFYDPRIFRSTSSFFEFRYKYKKLVRESEEFIPGIEDNSLSDVYHILTFSWGQQAVKNDYFLVEYMVGLGYSHCKSTRIYYDQWTGESSTETFRPDFLDDGHVPLAINIGLRVGLLPF
jgi:hypothetical protein